MTDGDKSAFPVPYATTTGSGMTYREYVAAHVLAAFASSYGSDSAVRVAVLYADKLIKQLNEEEGR